MIGIITGTAIVVLMLEYFIHRQNSLSAERYQNVIAINNLFETLKVLSYAPASHDVSLLADLKDILPALFVYEKLKGFILADNSLPETKIYHCSRIDSLIREDTKLSDLGNFLISQCKKQKSDLDKDITILRRIDESENTYITAVPLKELAEKNGFNLTPEELTWPNVVIMQLAYKSSVNGYLCLITQETGCAEVARNYMEDIGKVITLLVKKYEMNRLLSHAEQVEAVNKIW